MKEKAGNSRKKAGSFPGVWGNAILRAEAIDRLSRELILEAEAVYELIHEDFDPYEHELAEARERVRRISEIGGILLSSGTATHKEVMA